MKYLFIGGVNDGKFIEVARRGYYLPSLVECLVPSSVSPRKRNVTKWEDDEISTEKYLLKRFICDRIEYYFYVSKNRSHTNTIEELLRIIGDKQ